MKIINVQQGSTEWHQLRATKFTASEAPAMMGCGWMSRDELLEQKATGITPEVTSQLQALFNKGHAAEESARPIIEGVIGEELYPVTGTSDEHEHLLASLDGLTMAGDIVFEHKLWNEKLAEAVRNKDLPPKYYWQLEQQLLVSGAEKAVFVVSDGTADNMEMMDYYPVPGRAESLLAGWEQFRADLENYQPKQVKAEVTGTPVKDLPALVFRLNGLAVLSNLEDYKAAATQLVEDSKLPMETDQDFADRENLIKSFKAAEKKLQAAQENILGEITDVDQFVKDVKYIQEQIRQARLNSEKLVKAEKANRRNAIANAASDEIDQHVTGIESELGVRITQFTPAVAAHMKGKKTIASLQSAANDAVAEAKIELNQLANVARANLQTLDKEGMGYRLLFSDLQQIVFKSPDDFANLVKSRISEHKAEEQRKLEAERERIRAEEQRKAQEQAAIKAAQQKQVEESSMAPAPAEVQQPGVVDTKLQAIQQQKAIQISRPLPVGDAPAKAEKMIQISEREYMELLDSERMLRALQAAGVNNWSGYEEAQDVYEQLKQAA